MADQPYRPVYCCPCPACRRQPASAVAQQHTAINQLLATLDEKARRQLAGLLALQQGQGRITRIAQITALRRNTVRRGQRELHQPLSTQLRRIRQPGGGRKPIEKRPQPADGT